eukprot:CAMPEP_0118915558 /NCGR_PEP_ID=MMETSP1166-20130328/15702_1 /TAXON_ID=1104430 /ORGANISM="Chrysoreinhardia sp, Strain CCMP3193" /LENGTH=43 /DNA_ID= /DNA_START= /DNA_END= /DNA_ORIENTATION=
MSVLILGSSALFPRERTLISHRRIDWAAPKAELSAVELAAQLE